MKRIQEINHKVHVAMRSSTGRNLLTYLLFCLVAFVFWMMLSLDNEVQRDYDIPIELTDVPDSVTVITPLPSHVTVSVKGKGSQLIRYSWGRISPMKLDFRTYRSTGRFYLSRARLDTRLRDYFGQGVTVSAVRPDSIVLDYTTGPGVPMRVKVVADISPSLQSIVNGPLRLNTDTVMAYSAGTIPSDLHELTTEPVTLTGLKDTTVVTLKIKPVAGLRIIPDHVTLTIPVEALISKKVPVPLDVINTPEGERVLTFPSRVDVTFLVPMSSYSEDYPIRAYIDYDDTFLPGDKVPVKLGATPSIYHGVTFSPDSVEYLIEK